MNCHEIDSLLTRIPRCEPTSQGVRLLTDCLYPSSDPVWIYIEAKSKGYRVSDRGGALQSSLKHGCTALHSFDTACRKFSVDYREGEFVAEPDDADWLWPAIAAVSNASSMAARDSLENAMSKTEKSLKAAIFEALKSVVPESKIARRYEYIGQSGHVWPLDFAVKANKLVLFKAVVQNGNSINSNYATFGDIGDHEAVQKFCVFDVELLPDASALLRQVASITPVHAVPAMAQRHAPIQDLRAN